MIVRMIALVAAVCLLGGCTGAEVPPEGDGRGGSEQSAAASESLPADLAPDESVVVDTATQGSGLIDAPDSSEADAIESRTSDGETLPVPTDEGDPRPEEPVADEAAASSQTGLRVVRAYVCKGIEQSEPTEAGKSFIPEEDGVLRLCCFSEIAGAQAPVIVYHVWRWGEREMARVELEVESSRWRTWSTKRILDEWRGEWHVDIVDADGAILERLDFSVE